MEICYWNFWIGHDLLSLPIYKEWLLVTVVSFFNSLNNKD